MTGRTKNAIRFVIYGWIGALLAIGLVWLFGPLMIIVLFITACLAVMGYDLGMD